MYFIIRDLHKFTEEDSWQDGCLPETGRAYSVGVGFEGATPAEVIRKVCEFVVCGPDDIERDACEETGRVDFCVTENGDGQPLTESEREEWKAGKIKAYYAVYSGFVESVERVRLTK